MVLIHSPILKEKINGFRFQHIIERMIKIHPDQRYDSFASIMNDITSGVLSEIDFTKEQKVVYRQFADALCFHINHYSNKYSPVNDSAQTLSKLAELLRNSALEEYIQNNSQLIDCFISGGYNYNSRTEIEVETVANFYGLLTSLPIAKRKLLFSNIYEIGKY